jgi:hypothetical protein
MNSVNEVDILLKDGYTCIEVDSPINLIPNSILGCSIKLRKGEHIVKLNIEGKDRLELKFLFSQYNQLASV